MSDSLPENSKQRRPRSVKRPPEGSPEAAAKVAVRAPGAESARRALELVLCFTKDRHTRTARELAEVTGIPLPSVYRYVAFLRDMGLIYGDAHGGYRLTARWIALAQAAEAADPLIDLADPVMRNLSRVCGETVILVRLVSDAAVCVHRIESSHSLRISFEPGQPLSLDRGASARLLLASLPDAALKRRLDVLSAHDPARAARLRDQLPLVRARGWATSQEEIDSGIWAAAAAVHDGEQTVAALSVPSPLVRAPDSVRQALLDQVRAAAAEISAQLKVH